MSEEYETGVCVLRRKNFRAAYMEPTRSQMVENQHCFSCNFWSRWVTTIDSPTHLVIEGTHYIVGRESSAHRSSRGFGGSRFDIVTNDGRTITTTNLWRQGEVPDHFRDVLPDNARWAGKAAAA
ncbi:hypothetical protein LCGC14_0698440 [marine sediment metagenome]|uniref:Uncharacterized protein n=1 Tax=marine sediment metagenome TaxID=412755 RepID=A0A0F9QII3_9ZZZZ